MIRILLIPSSDYLGHPFPQRHNHLFERIHDGKDFEVHVLRFNLFGEKHLKTKCIIHEVEYEFKTRNAALYYLANAPSHVLSIRDIVRNESIDVIVVGNLLPPLLYTLISELSELKIPLIFDLQDYYPVSATGYIFRPESIQGIMLRGFFEVITRFLARRADIVTTPGIALYIYAKSIGVRETVIIPNGISEFFLKTYDGLKIRSKLGIDRSQLVVGYVGSIEFWLDMEPLIHAISILKRELGNIQLLLIGKHLQTGYARKVEYWIKDKYNIANSTIWLDFVPHSEVPKYIAAMDIGVIPFNIYNLTAYYAAPNKLWEYLSQYKLVLSTPIPEAILNKDVLEIVSTHQDYVRIIRLYAENKELFTEKVEKGRSKALNRTWNNSANKMKHIIKKLVERVYKS